MTGLPGRAAIDSEVRVCSSQVRSSDVELPASIGTLAEMSVAALGWSGTVLPPLKLLGRHIVPVAELVPDAHAERLCVGCGPVLDRTEIATWAWPEMENRVPPPAARISGVLAPARHWRSALTAAVPYARFTNAAIVVPQEAALTEDFRTACPFRAQQFGITVLAANSDSVRLVLPGRSFEDSPPVEPTAVSRWINEVIYEQLLAQEVPAPSRS